MTDPSESSSANADISSLPLHSEPKSGQRIQHDGSTYTTIQEGLAHILVPAEAPTSLDTKQYQQAQKDKTKQNLPAQSVFYNPIQQFNRDLSVLAIKAFSEHVIATWQEKAKQSAIKRAKKSKATGAATTKVEQQTDESVVLPIEYLEKPTTETAHAGGDGLTQGQTPSKTLKPKAEDDDDQRNSDEGSPKKQKISNAEPKPGEEPSPLKPTKRKADNSGDDADATERSTKKQRMSSPVPDLDEQVPLEEEASVQEPANEIEAPKNARSGPFRILDALSATGLRALRYAQEIPAATSITANDISAEATDSIKLNVEHNRLAEKVQVTTSNAMSHMYSLVGSKEHRYDVIDLDPYGTAVPFLDGAIQALADGGLLCVTCTDAGVWASNGYPEKTFSLYGGNPLKGRHSHEGGLRLILNAIAVSAARYGIAVEPLMSLSIDFYARIFVRLRKAPEQVKFLAGKTMLVYSCDSGCGATKPQLIGKNEPMKAKDGRTLYKHGMAQAPSCSPNCNHCGFKMHLAGPMWAGPLHNPRFLERLLESVPMLDKDVYNTAARIEGMVSTALEETMVEEYTQISESPSAEQDAERPDKRIIPSLPPHAIDRHPFFFVPQGLAGIIHSQAPGETLIKGALRHAGFRAARSHCQPGSIKTDAPWSFVWEMMREWARQKAPLKEGSLKPNTAGYAIMQKAKRQPPDNEADGALDTLNGWKGESEEDAAPNIVFDETLGRDKEKRKLVRYQTNPRENWGPMNKAKR